MELTDKRQTKRSSLLPKGKSQIWLYHHPLNCLYKFSSTHIYLILYQQRVWVRISIRARCTELCDKVCQWLATGQWFSPCPPVSSTNKTDCHDITEILLKVALNTIKQTNRYQQSVSVLSKNSYQMFYIVKAQN